MVSVAYNPDAPLAMIAGGGDLPRQIMQARQHDLFMIAIIGQTPPALTQECDHIWCQFGDVGKALDALKQRDITQLVMAGSMKRPSLRGLIPDAAGRALLKHLGSAMIAGDNRLLEKVMLFFEQQGHVLVPVQDICEALQVNEGVLTVKHPHAGHQKDAECAKKILASLSPYDIGQSIILADGHVLGIEAVEGTAALIARCIALRETGGILVKLPKLTQDTRADMPAIGVETIDALAAGRYDGAYIAANATLMLDRDAVIAQANAAGLFIKAIRMVS